MPLTQTYGAFIAFVERAARSPSAPTTRVSSTGRTKSVHFRELSHGVVALYAHHLMQEWLPLRILSLSGFHEVYYLHFAESHGVQFLASPNWSRQSSFLHTFSCHHLRLCELQQIQLETSLQEGVRVKGPRDGAEGHVYITTNGDDYGKNEDDLDEPDHGDIVLFKLKSISISARAVDGTGGICFNVNAMEVPAVALSQGHSASIQLASI
ncbi:hypothetical protein NM688_g7665 [Phlebia brevispora]|uniref:Uncharacterized protein n=1 Tax=Phlebia brevispora TaxID=194682 RepID=A0ACC1S2I8_9APHY|nr:hypothetical protein NM688_g7665 [Phlebia brevispora]